MWPNYQFSQENIMITKKISGKRGNQIEAFALYKLEKFNYDFSEEAERISFRDKISRVIAASGVPGQLLMLPTIVHADEAIEDWKHKSYAYDIRDFVDKYYDNQKEHLSNRYSAEYQPYIILNLYTVDIDDEVSRQFQRFEGDSLKEKIITGTKDFFNRYLAAIDGTIHISVDDWNEVKNKEKSMYTRLNRFSEIIRCNLKDIEWLVSRNFWKGIGEPKLISSFRDWSIPFEVEDELYKPTRSLKFLMNADTDFKSRHCEVKQLAGAGYQMYFTLNDIPTEGLDFPGQEFLYHSIHFDFPIEICVKWRPIKGKKVRKKINNIKLDIDDQEEMSGRFEGSQFEEVSEFDEAIRSARDSVMQVTFSFGLYSHDLTELEQAGQRFESHMESGQVQVVNPFGDQERGFVDFLPCAPIVVAEDYRHYCFPDAIAGGMPNASMNIGDKSGIYIGWHGPLSSPVFTEYPLLPSKDLPGGSAYFGPPGSGKSVLMNLLGIETVYHGGRSLFFDPKGDRTRWDRDVPGLQGKSIVANFGGDESLQDKGKFDPFRLYPNNPMYAMSIFTDIWSFLLDLEAGDIRVTALEESAQLIREMPKDERHTEALLSRYLELFKKQQRTRPEYETIVRQIKAKADHPLVGLMVGDGNEKPFYTDALLTVIQVHGLSFPDPESSGAQIELSSEQRISMACFMGIMGFAYKMLGNRENLNFVGLDEVWSISRIAKGKQFISKLLREGRAMQNLVGLATQQPSDLAGLETYLINMFIYRQKGRKNAEDACNMLDIPNVQENLDAINSLPKYNCLFKDRKERVAQMRVEITDKGLLKAFDTNPDRDKKERQLD